jgi:hypothetical protein
MAHLVVNLAARVWINFCDECLNSPLLCKELLIMAVLLLGLVLKSVYKFAGVNSEVCGVARLEFWSEA